MFGFRDNCLLVLVLFAAPLAAYGRDAEPASGLRAVSMVTGPCTDQESWSFAQDLRSAVSDETREEFQRFFSGNLDLSQSFEAASALAQKESRSKTKAPRGFGDYWLARVYL
jgi:hypothetical protein